MNFQTKSVFGILLTTLFLVRESQGQGATGNTTGGIPEQHDYGGTVFIGCDPKDPNCYYYKGKVSIGEPCMPDSNKTALFEKELVSHSQGPERDKLIDQLDRESCNISQATECRLTNSSDRTSHRCACVDPSLGDAPDAVEKSKYVRFDENKESCTFRVRYRCSNFTIPESGWRFNKTSGANVTVMDGRPVLYAYRCGNRSRCNVNADDVPKNNTAYRFVFYAEGGTKVERDPDGNLPHIVERESLKNTRGYCICEQGSMPSESFENGECEKIDDREWKTTGSFVGMFMMVVAFTVVLTIFLHDDDSDRYFDKGARRNF